MKAKKTKRIIIYAMCFLVPLAIATCYFIYRKFAPFGNSSIMTVDMGQQYIDFFLLTIEIPFYITQVVLFIPLPMHLAAE